MGLYHQQSGIPHPSLVGHDIEPLFPPGAKSLDVSRPSSSSTTKASLNATLYILNNYERSPTPKPTDKQSPFNQLPPLKNTMSNKTSNASSSLVQRRRLCFVTVGATAPFDSLINAVQTPRFLSALRKAGYTNLLVQHGHRGRKEESRNVTIKDGSSSSSDGKPGDTKLRVTSFDFRSDNLTREMLAARGDSRKAKSAVKLAESGKKSANAEGLDFGDGWQEAEWEEGVVISHAGSGSILDALRVSVPLIVVPNEKLLDNHQTELAEELAKQGYVVHGHVDQLAEALEESEALRANRKQWPPAPDKNADPNGMGLIGVMDEEMGYTDLKSSNNSTRLSSPSASSSTSSLSRPGGLHLD